MKALLNATFRIIANSFPTREFIRSVSVRDSWIISIGTSILSALTLMIPVPGQPAVEPMGYVLSFGTSIIMLVLFAHFTKWIANKYIAEKFTFDEMFKFNAVLYSGLSILFSVATLALGLMGSGVYTIGMVVFFVYGLYLLFAFQKGIAVMLSITKSQAAKIIVIPVVLIFLAFILLAAVGLSFV